MVPATTRTATRGLAASMTEPEPGPDRQELERAILGESPTLTRDAVADAGGVGVEQARRLWRSGGVPRWPAAAAPALRGPTAAGALGGAGGKCGTGFWPPRRPARPP